MQSLGCFLHCDLAATIDSQLLSYVLLLSISTNINVQALGVVSLDIQSRAKMSMELVIQLMNSRWRGFCLYRFEDNKASTPPSLSNLVFLFSYLRIKIVSGFQLVCYLTVFSNLVGF